ncbi:unnamed protein product [Clonostachys chloroleuca]|uniref:FAD-binding domain-containing protein n=1 Tax=Clonostachys chloroleuca TaxID=1926264 RepID=A0AA35LQL7_9HYPO|nr:unnamed protein product [Clonostachys chloroleuca]
MTTTSFYDSTGKGKAILLPSAAPGAHQSANPFFSTPETPVLIVGGGPIGVISAILLARYRIRSTIIEKHMSGLDLPKAHVIGSRTLEILRQAGFDIDRLRSLGPKPEDSDFVRFVTSLIGFEFGKIPLGSGSTEADDFTPESLANVPQPRLEDYLYEVAAQTGLITLWRGVEWRSSSVDNDGLEESVLFNRRTLNTIRMRSKYLLACDGANASSRTKLDIPFPDLPGQPVIKTHYVTVYFEADMSHIRSGILFFIISPSGLGTFISYDRASTWAFVMIYYPAKTPASFFTDDYCWSAIATAIGKPIPFKILSKTIWSTHPRVAEQYRSPAHPNAFLLGDAAHAFPPTGGLGLNTGFADAHNLAWKISAVEKGWTKDAGGLLDSYQSERIPVALANAQQSYANQLAVAELVEFILDTIGEEESPVRDSQSLDKLEKAVLENKDYFQAMGLHIGHIYGQEPDDALPVVEYVPGCFPGGRLPHAWIQVGDETRSTLDLVDGHCFLVLATRGFASAELLPFECNLGPHKVPVKTFRLGVDFFDLKGKWSKFMNMDADEAAILVRPDQHIVCQTEYLESLVEKLYSYLGFSG